MGNWRMVESGFSLSLWVPAMTRYFLLLAIAGISWYLSTVLDNQLVQWRTLPQPASTTSVVDTLMRTPMPADDLELQTLERKLEELGHSAKLEAISRYVPYRKLSQVLGRTPDPVATLGETKVPLEQLRLHCSMVKELGAYRQSDQDSAGHNTNAGALPS